MILFRDIPAVVEGHPLAAFIAAGVIAGGAPGAQALAGQDAVFLGLHRGRLEHKENMRQPIRDLRPLAVANHPVHVANRKVPSGLWPH
jgi:hypothetical protein